MKPAYLGGVRGYQSAVHRPSLGLSDAESRRTMREPAVLRRTQPIQASPLDDVYRRRAGFRKKAFFIASFATVAGLLAIAFVGSAQF
jgi:hypothetical protein